MVSNSTIKGRPKSGRRWKNQDKKRISSIIVDKPLKTSWEKKMNNKLNHKMVKAFEKQLKDNREKEIEERKKRREENLKRKVENERRGEQVQEITNTEKLRRMSKKELKKLRKQ